MQWQICARQHEGQIYPLSMFPALQRTNPTSFICLAPSVTPAFLFFTILAHCEHPKIRKEADVIVLFQGNETKTGTKHVELPVQHQITISYTYMGKYFVYHIEINLMSQILKSSCDVYMDKVVFT